MTTVFIINVLGWKTRQSVIVTGCANGTYQARMFQISVDCTRSWIAEFCVPFLALVRERLSLDRTRFPEPLFFIMGRPASPAQGAGPE